MGEKVGRRSLLGSLFALPMVALLPSGAPADDAPKPTTAARMFADGEWHQVEIRVDGTVVGFTYRQDKASDVVSIGDTRNQLWVNTRKTEPEAVTKARQYDALYVARGYAPPDSHLDPERLPE